MRYRISRTSGWAGKPCEEAFEVECARLDRRTFTSPEEHDKRINEVWLSRGSNHTTWDNNGKPGIVRSFPSKAWVVEVDDLPAFCRKYGQLVLSPNGDDDCSELELEIYDGYRE